MTETTERIRACSVPTAALLLDRSERTLCVFQPIVDGISG